MNALEFGATSGSFDSVMVVPDATESGFSQKTVVCFLPKSIGRGRFSFDNLIYEYSIPLILKNILMLWVILNLRPIIKAFRPNCILAPVALSGP